MTSASTTSRTPARGWPRVRMRARNWRLRLDSPLAVYYLLATVTGILVVFGLIMVLSASTVVAIGASATYSPYGIFLNQLLFASVGLVLLLIASRQPVERWKTWALPMYLAAIVLQLLVFVPGLGKAVYGNRNWIVVAGIQVQPSEGIKIALALLGGVVMARQRKRLGEVRVIVLPYLVPCALVAIALVLAGNDLGTTLILIAVVAGVMFTAGVPARWFALAAGLGASLATLMVLISPNRLQRFDVWLGRDVDPYGNARQPIHGRYALADGGWFGLGLGASREKWNWLSAPHNDFIFAIIGEELGLPGTLLVLLLFAAIAVAAYRLVTRSTDPFVRIATGGITAWILAQAAINIGAVIGLLPVIGVPLPLISSGGSSLIATMLGLGILLGFARSEPACAAALSARRRPRRGARSASPGRLRRARTGGAR